MKTKSELLLSLLILVTLFSCAQTPQQIEENEIAPTVPLEPQNVRNAVVRIVSPPEIQGFGNGFFVAHDKVVTNIHLIADANPVSGHVRGRKGTRSIQGVTAYDVKNNLVILKVSGENGPLPLADSNAVKVGDAIFDADPLSRRDTSKNTRGTILGIRDDDKWFSTTLSPDPRISGGAVLNSELRVIGIEVMEGEFGYVIPSNTLKVLLTQSDTVEPFAQWQQRDEIRAYSYVQQAKRKFSEGDHSGMMEMLNEAIELNPEFAAAYANRGQGKLYHGELESEQGNTLEAQKHYRSAIDDYNNAIRLNPEFAAAYKDRAFAKKLLASTEVATGRLKEAERNYNEAITDYAEVIKRVPSDAATYTDRGTTKKEFGAFESERGNVPKAQRHYRSAIDDYTQAIECKPDYTKAYYNRGLVRDELGQQEAAKVDFEKAETLKWKQSTVSIEGSFGPATGFFVDRDKIATNIHVIATGAPIIARSVDQGTVWTFEGFTAFDVDNDLVILKIAGKGVPLPLGDSNDVQFGEPVSIVGYLTNRYKVAEGTVLGVRNRDKWIEMEAENYDGNGGSPVINSKGEVIGITSAAESLFRYVIPSNALKVMFDQSEPLEPLAQWREKGLILESMYFERGLSNYESERYVEAIADFDGLIRLNPERADIYYNRGLAKLILGDLESDRGNIEEARKLYESGVGDSTQAIERIPEDAETYHNRAGGKFRLAQSKTNRSDIAKVHQYYQDAIHDWTQVTELNSEFADPYSFRAAAKAGLGKSKANQGNILEAKKLYLSAIEDCNQAIWLNPEFADPYINRGYARFNLGETIADGADLTGAHVLYEEAVQDYTQAIELDSESAHAYKNRGVAKAALGNPETAIEDFDAAIQIDPEYAEAYYQRGRAKETFGQIEAAKTDFEKAKLLDPDVGQ